MKHALLWVTAVLVSCAGEDVTEIASARHEGSKDSLTPAARTNEEGVLAPPAVSDAPPPTAPDPQMPPAWEPSDAGWDGDEARPSAPANTPPDASVTGHDSGLVLEPVCETGEL